MRNGSDSVIQTHSNSIFAPMLDSDYTVVLNRDASRREPVRLPATPTCKNSFSGPLQIPAFVMRTQPARPTNLLGLCSEPATPAGPPSILQGLQLHHPCTVLRSFWQRPLCCRCSLRPRSPWPRLQVHVTRRDLQEQQIMICLLWRRHLIWQPHHLLWVPVPVAPSCIRLIECSK